MSGDIGRETAEFRREGGHRPMSGERLSAVAGEASGTLAKTAATARPAEGLSSIAARLDEALRATATADGSPPRSVDRRSLPFVTLADVEERPVEWLAEHLVPFGALTLLVGRGGLGKTTLTLEMAARLTRGQAVFPGLAAPEPADVLIVSGEDALAQVLRPRARLAGADLSRLHALDLAEADLAIPEDVDALRDAIEHVGARLVIVDPISGFLGRRIDSHKDASLRGALRPFHALAEATGAAVVGIIHPNQSGSADVAHAVAGAGAWVNAARSALVFGRKPDASEIDPARIVAAAKSNYGPLGVAHELRLTVSTGETHPTLTYVGRSSIGHADLLANADPEGRGERAEAEELLRLVLGVGDWHESSEVKRAAGKDGIGEKVLRIARERIGVETRREGSGRDGSYRSLWRLVYSCPPPVSGEGTSNDGTSKRPVAMRHLSPNAVTRALCADTGTSNDDDPTERHILTQEDLAASEAYAERFRARAKVAKGPLVPDGLAPDLALSLGEESADLVAVRGGVS